MWLEHFAVNGTLLGYAIQNLNYNFALQYASLVTLTLLPGETMKTHCVWDSTSRNTTTYGSEDTSSEMCYGLVMYYPRVASGACLTSYTAGCNCSFESGTCNSAKCGGLTVSCASHANCSSCSADTNCGWCNSASYAGCLNSNVQAGCSSIGGSWNSCAAPGNGCTTTYNSCATCSAQPTCEWCYRGASATSLCLGKVAQAGAVCDYFSGSLATSC